MYTIVKLFSIDLFYSLFLQMVTRTKKIFVGGLSAPSTLEDVKNYFEQFGRVSSFFVNFEKFKSCLTEKF